MNCCYVLAGKLHTPTPLHVEKRNVCGASDNDVYSNSIVVPTVYELLIKKAVVGLDIENLDLITLSKTGYNDQLVILY